MKNELAKMKKEMYKIRRLQMYVVFIRLGFSLFIIGELVMNIVNAITIDNSYIILKIILILLAYVINVYAYHMTMMPLEKNYQQIKTDIAHVEENEQTEENTSI